MINLDSNFNKVYEELTTLNETNKVVRRFANNTWYSGDFRALNDISTAVSPEELERKRKEEEERKQEAERKELERAAKTAIVTDRVPFYNWNHRFEIRDKEYCPAIDLDTQEFVYDPEQKEEIVKASKIIVDQKRQASTAKGMQTKANNQAAQATAEARTYLWTAYYTINGKTFTIVDEVLGNEDPKGACLAVKHKAVDAIKQEMHECRVFGEPFQWDGKLLITITFPSGNDKTYKQYDFNKKA